MTISVILAAYNGEKFIFEQIRSIAAQSRPADEVLIIDDGSTDRTVKIVEDFIREYAPKGWRIVQNKENRGWKQNFKDGILMCEGDLIFPCDQDDIWMTDKLKCMERVMEKNPQISVLASQYRELYEDGSDKNLFKVNDKKCVRADWKKKLFNVLYPGCTFCIRKTYLAGIVRYWDGYAHDAFLWRFAMLSDSAYIFRDSLIFWRKHGDSTFQKDNRRERNYEGKIKWLEYAEHFLAALTEYVQKTEAGDKESKMEGLERYQAWSDLRKLLYESRNPAAGIKLIKYLSCYSRKRQYIGDWIIAFFWKKHRRGISVMESMDSEELRILHGLLLGITTEIDRICQKNNITYSLTGGSMLGAVRHNGFIPWDDDMDIAMLRGEYERFVKACEEDLSDEFELQTAENDPDYVYGFAKILLRGTGLVQYGHKKTKHRKGIYVDIFPLDQVPANLKKRNRHKWKNYILIKLLFRKAGCEIEGEVTLKKRLAFGAADFINIFLNAAMLKEKLIQNMKRYDAADTELVCNMGGYYGYDRETTKRIYFEETVRMPFETCEFSVSRYWHEYLKGVYGDYMELPPEEKRHTHGFLNLDFGKYAERG